MLSFVVRSRFCLELLLDSVSVMASRNLCAKVSSVGIQRDKEVQKDKQSTQLLLIQHDSNRKKIEQVRAN